MKKKIETRETKSTVKITRVESGLLAVERRVEGEKETFHIKSFDLTGGRQVIVDRYHLEQFLVVCKKLGIKQ